jgi:hypothetical protein
MTILHMERIGGLAGFGTGRARIRSHGQFETTALSSAEFQAVEQLFQGSTPGAESAAGSTDGFSLRLTRSSAEGSQSVVVPESAVPASLLRHLKDELI